MLTTIVTSVLGAITVTAIIAIARSRWLYLVVPKLYFDTPLSKGNVVTFTLTNGGFRSEEDVRIVLKKTCSYELLASSKSTTTYSANTVSVPRIGKFESVTALLLVEGKVFEHSDIESVESKETIGKVVEKKEHVNSLRDHAIIWPVLILILSVPFVGGTFVGKSFGMSAWDYVEFIASRFGESKQLAGYRSDIGQITGFGELAKSVKAGEVSHSVVEVLRQGDTLRITVRIVNKSERHVRVDVVGKSSARSKGPLDYSDERIDDLFVARGDQGTGVLRAYLPESERTQMVELQVKIYSGSDYASYTQTLVFN